MKTMLLLVQNEAFLIVLPPDIESYKKVEK